MVKVAKSSKSAKVIKSSGLSKKIAKAVGEALGSMLKLQILSPYKVTNFAKHGQIVHHPNSEDLIGFINILALSRFLNFLDKNIVDLHKHFVVLTSEYNETTEMHDDTEVFVGYLDDLRIWAKSEKAQSLEEANVYLIVPSL